MAKAKRAPQTKKKVGGPRPPGGGPRLEKVAAVDEIRRWLTESSAVVLAEYRGMSVGELAELRAALRGSGARFKVVKNTLTGIAAKGAGLEDLLPLLEGPTAVAYGQGDPVALAKQLADAARKTPALVIKGGLLEGRVLSAKEAGALATLETRDVLLGKAAGMFASPLYRVARVFAAPLHQVGAVLAQLRDRREQQDAA